MIRIIHNQARGAGRYIWVILVFLLGSVAVPAQVSGTGWVMRNDPPTQIAKHFWGVANNGSRFVAVGMDDTGNHETFLMTSDDLVNWTARSISFWAILYDVVYAESKFVVPGSGGLIMTSADGAIWTKRNSGIASGDLEEVCYGGGLFIVNGLAGYTTSSDGGVTWSVHTPAPLPRSLKMIYDGSKFVAAAAGGRVYTSTNGTSWTLRFSPGNALISVAYGGGMYVVGGRDGAGNAVIYSSPDAYTWTLRSAPAHTGYVWDLIHDGTVFFGVGEHDYIITSPDGINWTKEPVPDPASGAMLSLYALTNRTVGAASLTVGVGICSQIVSHGPLPPAVMQHPDDVVTCESTAAEFCVTAAGEPAVSYQWERDTGGGWGDIAGAQSDCYQIGSVSTSDAGQYRCRVTNVHGSATSDPATLTLRFAPSTFSEQPESQSVCEFESVQFCVTADGSAPLSYQWERDIGGWGTIPGAQSDCYTIGSASSSDVGSYRCRVWNECGTATSNEAALDVTERAKADFDCDLDVDQDDFGHFQVCLTGPGEPQTDPACVNARLDGDTDVDADDFARFLNCLSGPGITAVVNCAD